MKEYQNRADVPVELTWDLSLIYPNSEAMETDIALLKELCDELCETYRNQLTSSDIINTCLDRYREYLTIQNHLENYARLNLSGDYSNAAAQQLNGRIKILINNLSGRLTFIESELSVADETVLTEAIGKSIENRDFLSDILRDKPHRLSPEAETLLARLSPALGAPTAIYTTGKLADIRFPSITVDGVEYPMGYSLYEDNYAYDPRTNVRRTAFEVFSKKIGEYRHTTAAVYNAHVQNDKILSDLRGFSNVFDSLLYPQKVTREMYDRQIDLITTRLAPHMRRYAALLKKIHGLDTMTFADLKISVDPAYVPSITVEEAKPYLEEGLAILGPDYVEMIRTAFAERWVDFAKNEGKSTGGFCAVPYGLNSFILMSWNDRMADVMTLAHELGHAGHFRISMRENSLFGCRPTMYFIESPSTMNELLMAHHLLKTNEDKRFRRWVLSSMISNTYYHNFVTHLLEAAYQREVYKIIDAGGSVQAETLSRIKREVLEQFWGDDVVINEGAELTWMRQPHYYRGLYSYTYSAGLTIATQVCKRIETEGAPAVEDWKKVLAAGGTLAPADLAALAGIDITTDAPLIDTIDTIGGIIDEIIRLTEELEQK